MRCALYRCDVPVLLSALTDVDMVVRWQQAVGDERPCLADRPLLIHLKRLEATAARMLASGFEACARQDRAAVDALLTDLFAVATWHGWELPVQPLEAQDLILADLPRGLLGADISDGAGLWLIDGSTIALARDRQASDQADWSSHVRAHGHPIGR